MNDEHCWLQIKGDPSIRQYLFEQQKVHNVIDKNIDKLIILIHQAFLEHDVFHAKIHFSSGQITLWLKSDPMRYRVFMHTDMLQPDFFQQLPTSDYPTDALIEESMLPTILHTFKELRNFDDNIYLRSGSINIMNDRIGLNFSCDGSHYLSHKDLFDNIHQRILGDA